MDYTPRSIETIPQSHLIRIKKIFEARPELVTVERTFQKRGKGKQLHGKYCSSVDGVKGVVEVKVNAVDFYLTNRHHCIYYPDYGADAEMLDALRLKLEAEDELDALERLEEVPLARLIKIKRNLKVKSFKSIIKTLDGKDSKAKFRTRVEKLEEKVNSSKALRPFALNAITYPQEAIEALRITGVHRYTKPMWEAWMKAAQQELGPEAELKEAAKVHLQVWRREDMKRFKHEDAPFTPESIVKIFEERVTQICETRQSPVLVACVINKYRASVERDIYLEQLATFIPSRHEVVTEDGVKWAALVPEVVAEWISSKVSSSYWLTMDEEVESRVIDTFVQIWEPGSHYQEPFQDAFKAYETAVAL